ncbi:ubiE/COQ5 methyltransferase [Dendryphion nanum]|uniref:Arsenite methyltransferase n=1 Tax=Dendryphion nanum TaxID=256645 RepID=A0A9P9II08_9PLEO|nr:ubiE/COQ5 methyltransferase [Dendryphion nanum]
MDAQNIYQRVQDHYGSLARTEKHSSSSAIAQAFGYTEEQLNEIPQGANLGVSCGNPLAIATLRTGETVIDLGSGAGFDVFLAGKQVGLQGRAIGVDMNKDMLARARNNHAKSGSAENVSFIEGQITSIPIENGIADCIISNCVINLVPEVEKPAVFAEMARLLKPGGRVAISDILAKKPLPNELRESVAAYVGCVAGCSPKEDYEHWLAESGFSDIVIVDAQSDLNVYFDMADDKNQGDTDVAGSCCAQPCSNEGSKVSSCWNLAGMDINEWAGSFKIFAVKN